VLRKGAIETLRRFERVSLILLETRRITITLSPGDLSFVTAEGDRQLIPGGYRLTVGSGLPAAAFPEDMLLTP
jgi:beta-glucosidase